ncbi:MAG TPA: hypothetical protein VIN40_03880 [Candidatus Tyrphobacter sp.]
MSHLHWRAPITTQGGGDKGSGRRDEENAAAMSDLAAMGRLDEQLNSVKERL